MHRRLLRWLPLTILCSCLAAPLVLLSACGSGGGSTFAGLSLGLVSSTVPTTVPYGVTNPLSTQASVSALPSAGPFAFEPSQFPQLIAPGAVALLDLVFTPEQPGDVQGEARLLFDDGSETREVSVLVRATAERVHWELDPATPYIGPIAPGSSQTLVVTLRNASTLSPVTFTSAQLPGSGFTLLTPAFPLSVGPQEAAVLELQYAPAVSSFDGGSLLLDAIAPALPLPIPLLGFTTDAAGDWEFELGTLQLTGTVSPWVEIDVPAQARSLAVEFLSAGSTMPDIHEWQPPSGPAYRTASGSGILRTYLAPQVLSVHVPNSDAPEAQLPPAGGTHRLRVRAGRNSQIRGYARVRIPAPGPPGPHLLDLNLWCFPATGVTAASAPSDPVLQGGLARLEEVLSAHQITLGEVEYLDAAPGAPDRLRQHEDLEQLCLQTQAAPATRVNVFLVMQVLSGTTIGLSGAIDGPKRNGTRASGLAVRMDGFLSPNVLGLILAHEICHYLGLYHTRESSGNVRDLIQDTAPCASGLPPGTCEASQPPNLMYYSVEVASHLTPGQVSVLLGHPFVRPAPPPPSPKPHASKTQAPAPGHVSPPAQEATRARRAQWLKPWSQADYALVDELQADECACGHTHRDGAPGHPAGR